MNITGLRTSSKYGATLQGIDALYNQGWNIVKTYVNTLTEVGMSHTSYGYKDKALLKFKGANIYWYMITLMINIRQELINLGEPLNSTGLATVRDKYNLDCVESNLTCLSKNYGTNYFTVYKALIANYFTITADTYVPTPPVVVPATDWYLPTIGDYVLINLFLKENNIGNFTGQYWTSCSLSGAFAEAVAFIYDFATIESTQKARTAEHKVRPMREFTSFRTIPMGEIGEKGYVFNYQAVGDGSYIYYEVLASDIGVVAFGASGIATGNTTTVAKAGQANTTQLVAVLVGNSETGKAAQLCDSYSL
jgi:hypothetical protein